MGISEVLAGISVFFPKHPIEPPPTSIQWAKGEAAAGRLSIRVAENLEGVEELRAIWKLWAHSPETDFDYYLYRLQNDSTIVSPYVVTVSEDSIPQAILVGHIRKHRLSATVSFVNIRGPEARVLEIVNGGRLGKESDVIDKIIARQILQCGKSAAVDMILFRRLLLESSLFQELWNLRGVLTKQRIPHIFRYLVLPLTTCSDNSAPVLSGKTRRENRRKTRILHRTFPGRVSFKCFSNPRELTLGILDAGTVSVTTWQHYSGQDSLDHVEVQDILRFCVSKGWLRIYVMYIDDSPCAFLIGNLYQGTFYCAHAGYSPAFAKFSVGSLLTAWVLENLHAAGVKEVDLGEGGQEHHRRLGCCTREEGTVHLYFPTWRGLRLNMFFAAAHTLRAAGRRTITKLRLSRASRAWSQLLISRWKSGSRRGYTSL